MVAIEDIRDVANLRIDDLVVALMGPTGAGKSNLLDNLTGQPGKRSGTELKSYTDKVQAVRIRGHPLKGDRIVLVDTPGFDDTNKSDMEILAMIGKWLSSTYKKRIKLSGILYLHRITDNRMSGSPYKNLRMFGKLCGDQAAKRVILVTTMWDKVSNDVGRRREDELKAKYWAGMINAGSTTGRFNNTKKSAWDLMETFLEHDNKETALLQEELVELGKKLNETQAGMTLYSALQKVLADQKETIRLLSEQAATQSNPQLKKQLDAEYKKTQKEFDKTFNQIKSLKIPFGRRILLFFSFKKARAQSIAVV